MMNGNASLLVLAELRLNTNLLESIAFLHGKRYYIHDMILSNKDREETAMCKELTDEQAESVVGGEVVIKGNHDRTTTIKLTELNKEYIVNQSTPHVLTIINIFYKNNRGKYARQHDYEEAVERLIYREQWI